MLLISLSPATDAEVILDADADGLLDAWEIQHFGSLSHPDGDPEDNPDADACNNLAESEAGTDPNDRSDCFHISSVVLDPLELEVSWQTTHGKRYQIELSDNLFSWAAISTIAGNRPLNFFGTGGVLEVNFPRTGLDTTSGSANVTGGVTREIWYHGDANGTITHLRRHINPSQPIDPVFPVEEEIGNEGGVQELEPNPPTWKIRPEVKPDGVEWRSSLKGPSNYADNYGSRWRGFIVPKQTASYNFYIAGRHQCEFWLDTTGDPTDGVGLSRRCFLHDQNLTEEEDWDYLASQGLPDTQKSLSVTLTAGRKYYFEILHNHGAQWDHLAVGWEADQSGTISVLPGDCLRPLEDFLTTADYTSSNLATLLANPGKKFVRIRTFGPLNPNTLDTDRDEVPDDVENLLAGYLFFRPQSALAGQSDGETLTAAAAAIPDEDVMTVEVQDALGREDNGQTAAGIPRVKDVARFYLNRSGSLVPKTVFFRINGASDPIAKGDPGPGDYVAERPDGTAIIPSGINYALTIPFGGTRGVVEARPVLDEIVEFPEEINLVLI
ncbi:MAG: hypothetical protein HKO57_04310, partial [Akkermansiaceae bacterium]|nr:hypothetical protein [Akkermansiaceae bacterium]